jgi:HEAT repeat protein
MITLALLLAAAVAPADEPAFTPETHFADRSYGSAFAVKLLGDVLDEPDVLARVAATADLGETDNSDALSLLAKASRDNDARVRATAATAAAVLNKPGSLDVVAPLLTDTDSRVVLRVLDAIRRLQPAEPPVALTDLLGHDDPLVRASTLQTWTALGRPAPDATLATLVVDPTVFVRLRALANALLCSDGARWVDAVDAAQPPAVRAAAIEVLGKFAFATSRDSVAKASKDDHILVRRGAARAYGHAQAADDVCRMLDDPSPIVRLAAIRAAGDLGINAATDRLVELMLTAPDEQAHRAARRALLTIGTDDVAARLAQALSTLLAELTADRDPETSTSQRRGERLDRNAMSCCDILGEIFAGRPQQAATLPGTDTMLNLLDALDINERPVGAAAEALGRIGDARAIPLLRKLLATCATNRGDPPPSGDVTGQICLGLAALQDPKAPPLMIDVINVNGQPSRLSRAVRYIMDVLPTFDGSPHAEDIREAVLTVLDPATGFGRACQAHAARAAVRLDLKDATTLLEELLDERTGGREVLQIFAWALSQLTGADVHAPNPRPKACDGWIVRPVDTR